MIALFSREVVIDEDDVRADVIDMSPYQVSVFLQAVVEGLFGERMVDERRQAATKPFRAHERPLINALSKSPRDFAS